MQLPTWPGGPSRREVPSADRLITDTSARTAPVKESYTSDHLELFHHLKNNLDDIFWTGDSLNRRTLDAFISSALLSPYLTDELLAISAMHLSTLPQLLPRRADYLYRADQLHHRALVAFQNTAVGENSDLDACLFYSLSGLYRLLDVFSFKNSFTDVLDRFVLFIRVQHKCRNYAQRSASVLRTSPFGPVYEVINKAAAVVSLARRGHEYDELSVRLDGAELTPAAREACQDAVTQLQWTFDMIWHLGSKADVTIHILFAWPATISESYIKLITQRQPEALVVLAHYATLVQSCSTSRGFSDCGVVLSHLISRHLGSYWEAWLQPGTPAEMQTQ
ncbi:hypothetical protein E8E14_000525 [Neopestalotiopsis sp. 37M]|nr:hypothetical protein E8E14_000525 [Neopestalotiopsis sp. 37M]